MHDVLYLLGTLGFFALMLAYVRACETLGSDDVQQPIDARGGPNER